MIRKLKSPAPGVLCLSLSGTISADDYDQNLAPEVDTALEAGPLRLVIVTEDDFTGFTGGATLTDLRFGLAHRHDVARLALVSESSLVRIGAHLIAPFVPFEVKLFHNNELHAATDWCGMEGSPRIHSLNKRLGVLTIKPRGELDRRQLEMLSTDVDAYLQKKDKLAGVLLDIEHFPGWQNLAALATHLRIVRDHHSRIRRFALSTDEENLSNLPKLAELFVNAQIRNFSRRERQIAKEWLQSAD